VRTLLKVLLPLALLLAAVAPAAAADQAPTPDVTPEAVLYSVGGYSGTLPIASPADAHAAVLAAGGPFADFTYNDGALIGATKYYDVKGEAGIDTSWIVVYTYGWNDCASGCINGHSFVYQIDPLTGAATFDSHQGDALPADAPVALIQLAGRSGGLVPEPYWRTVTGDPVACPQGITDPGASISNDTVLPCILPDGSLFGNQIPVDQPGGPGGPVVVADRSTQSDNSWTTTLPAIILAALLAWIGAAALVGRSKRRAA